MATKHDTPKSRVLLTFECKYVEFPPFQHLDALIRALNVHRKQIQIILKKSLSSHIRARLHLTEARSHVQKLRCSPQERGPAHLFVQVRDPPASGCGFVPRVRADPAIVKKGSES